MVQFEFYLLRLTRLLQIPWYYFYIRSAVFWCFWLLSIVLSFYLLGLVVLFFMVCYYVIKKETSMWHGNYILFSLGIVFSHLDYRINSLCFIFWGIVFNQIYYRGRKIGFKIIFLSGCGLEYFYQYLYFH